MILSIREKLTGIIAIAIIFLLAIPLAFVGVESIFLNSSKVSNVGSVNGKDITETEFRRAVLAREGQIANLFGDNYTPGIIDSKLLESSAANGLVDLYLYYTHAKDSGMGVTDEYVAGQIRQIPEFQTNGQFSEFIYNNYLNQLGFTSSGFIESVGNEILSNAAKNGVLTSAIATELVLQSNLAVAQEARSYQTITLAVDSVLDEVELTESDILAYYEGNQPEFAVPERVRLDYVELSPEAFTSDIEISKSEVEKRFELVRATLPTRRQAAHILVELKDDNSHVATLDAIQLALDEGADFSEVVAEFSDDLGSSASGGVLGYTDGSSFPQEFEAALAELEVDEVSAPVLTEAGFHVIKLIDIEEPDFSLEKEYGNLENELINEQASEIYRQNLTQLRDASFSSASLEELVSQFAVVAPLKIVSTDVFSQQSGSGIAQNADVRAVAFSDIVLQQKENSDVIELDESRAVVVRVKEYFEAGTADLDEVRDTITASLERIKGSELLQARAASIQQRIEQGESVEDVARDEDLEWQVQLDAKRGAGGVEQQLIFAAELTSGFPVVGADVLSNGDYLIYSIDSASAGTLDDFNTDQVNQLSFQLSQGLAASEARAYAQTLKDDADIDFKIDVDIR